MSSVATFVNTATICFILYILYKNNLLLDTFSTDKSPPGDKYTEDQPPALGDNPNVSVLSGECNSSTNKKEPRTRAKKQLLPLEKVAAIQETDTAASASEPTT